MSMLSRREVISAGVAFLLAAGISPGVLTATDSKSNSRYAKVAGLVNREKLIHWALELAAIYSPTGHEGSIAEYLYLEFRKLGLQAKLQPISPGRGNAIGRLEGRGDGYDLMFNGHLDTFAASNIDQRKYTFAGPRSVYADGSQVPPLPKAVDDQWLFGHEIANMKSAFAAYLAAVDALLRSDVERKGAVMITGVAGTDPTLTWTEGNGGSTDDEIAIGMRHMLSHGVTADMCVLGEPTNLELIPAHTGRLRLKLTLLGEAWNAPGAKVGQLLTALQDWIPEYQKAHQYRGVTPSAGLYGPVCRQDAVSGDCSLFVELRILPNQHPLDVVSEVRGLTRRLAVVDPTLDIHLETLLVEPGSEVNLDAPVVRALRDAHLRVAGKPPDIGYVAWGADATRLNQAGIPTLIYGPGNLPGRKGYTGASNQRYWDYQNIDELQRAAQVYAVLAAGVCSRER
jgi:acetylornithine deacetylase